PLVSWLVYTHNGKNLKTLALWFLPVFLIPLLWPLQSILVGQFDLWIRDVLWQTHRSSYGLGVIAGNFIRVDPVLFIISLAGLAFAAIRKNFFILIWTLPFVAFLALIGYVQYFHSIMLLPIFCIASAVFIMDSCKKINRKKLQKVSSFVIVAGISVFGLASTTMIITADLSKSEFQAMAFVLQHVQNNTDTTILSGPTYSWVFSYIFHKQNVPIDYSEILFGPIKTKNVLLVADPHFLIDIGRGKQLSDVYNETKTIATFDKNASQYNIYRYPYTSMITNDEGNHIDIREKN
ncbi:MAG: ArnT family glycosyltransferase, partial [Nitrosotalea sp.]